MPGVNPVSAGQEKWENDPASREQRLNAFFSNATAGFCILNADLQYVQINETLARLHGLPAGEHLGKTVREVLPKLASELEPILRRALAGDKPVLNLDIWGEMPGAAGSLRHWIGSCFPFPGEQESTRAIGCVVMEITEQKCTLEKLRESEEDFRQLAENIHKVFWIWDGENRSMLYVNPAYEQIWGRSRQSLYERPSSFADAIHPADRNRILAGLERPMRGEAYEEEYRIARPDGSVRWIHERRFAVRNEKREFCRVAGLAEDVTERKQLEEQLRQAQKMEAIGQLAGGVAHDFHNILTAVLIHIGLLEQSLEPAPGAKESLREIEMETMRAANLTRQL